MSQYTFGRSRDEGYAIAALAFFSLTACGGVSTTPPAVGAAASGARAHVPLAGCPCLYVANRGTLQGASPSITIYPEGARRKAPPTAKIAGSNTALNDPWGVTLDSSGNIYVTDSLGNSITEYAAGATGNASPIATIGGTNTDLDDPSGIALDASNEIYVTNFATSTVAVFAAGASGNASPVRLISGSNTSLAQPLGIAIDGGGNVYVASSTNDSVEVFASGATGNVTPAREIDGSNTRLNFPSGLTIDGHGDIFVANSGDKGPPWSVNVFAPGANGNAAPSQYIEGKHTKLDDAYGIALDSRGDIHVASEATNLVTTYRAMATGNVRPISKLHGKKTGVAAPVGIFIR